MNSAWRLPATMNSEPKLPTMKNQTEIGTSTATAPAMSRSTKPAATIPRSTTATCFSHAEYVVVKMMYVAIDDRELPAGEEPDADPADEQDHPGDLRGADRDVAGRDRAEALLGVEAVGFDVERVVEEVGAARREAERDERDERVEDGLALAEDAGRRGGRDDEDVLDPLLRPGLVR